MNGYDSKHDYHKCDFINSFQTNQTNSIVCTLHNGSTTSFNASYTCVFPPGAITESIIAPSHLFDDAPSLSLEVTQGMSIQGYSILRFSSSSVSAPSITATGAALSPAYNATGSSTQYSATTLCSDLTLSASTASKGVSVTVGPTTVTSAASHTFDSPYPASTPVTFSLPNGPSINYTIVLALGGITDISTTICASNTPFSTNTQSYAIYTAVSSVNFDTTTNSSFVTAVYTVNGVQAPSGNIALNTGATTVVSISASESGVSCSPPYTPYIYTIYQAALSLTNLATSVGSLTPDFDPLSLIHI